MAQSQRAGPVPTPLADPAKALQIIVELLDACACETGERLSGVGVGCTGPVDPWAGVVGNVALLPGWQGFPLVDHMQRALRLDVAMENDADAAALAEAAWGAGRDAERFIYVTISTGIGTGLVLDGSLYRGAGGAHPEAGHHTVDSTGPLCYCGARGCWEIMASGTAMSAWAAANATEPDRRPYRLCARDLCELARRGDPLAMRAIARESHYLALGLANLVTMFCPDRIALGGGVMESFDLLLPAAIEETAGLCGLVPFHPDVIAKAHLRADAPLLGAARVWQHRTAASPKVSKNANERY